MRKEPGRRIGILLLLFLCSASIPADHGIQPRLPRVLIIGDSISLGYTPFVQEILKGEAEVKHNPGNAQSTWHGLKQLEAWLGENDWDLIHFNWGLWDLCYRHPDAETYGNRDKLRGSLTTYLDDYRKNLDNLIAVLKKSDAILIWAYTTPVPRGEAGRFAVDAYHYNQAAFEVMRRHRIPINDLYALMLPTQEKYRAAEGDVHFTKEGYQRLAVKVAAVIREKLKRELPLTP